LPVMRNSQRDETKRQESSLVASRKIESTAMSYGSHTRMVLSSDAE